MDHETSPLDYIRKSNVASSLCITQSVGAYEIEQGRTIDTRDEAFSKMAPGANVADVAILVVAADEGVKPETKEALKARCSKRRRCGAYKD